MDESQGPTGERAVGREQWVDVAKALAITGVVLFHAASFAGDEGAAHGVWTLASYGLFTFINPLFFLASGLFLGPSLRRPFRQFFSRRVWPLAYLWVAWSLLYVVLAVATDGRLGYTFAQSIALQTILWYLAALTIHTLVARLIRDVPAAIQVVGSAALYLPFAVLSPFEGWGLTHTPMYLVFFLAGCCFSRQVRSAVQVTRLRHVAALGLLAMGLGVTAVLVRPTAHVIYALVIPIALALVLMSAYQIARVDVLVEPLAYLGRNTLPVYLVHIGVLQGTAWFLSDEPSQAVAYVLPLVVTAAAVAMGLLTERMLRGIPGIFEPWPRPYSRRPEGEIAGRRS